jgi:DNA-binding MarR family transcriptional regulator
MTKKDNKDKNTDQLIGTFAYSLVYALNWVDESLQASLEAAGWQRMSRTRSMIMLNITAGIDRPAAMARGLGISRQAIHQLLQGLKDEGVIELVPDPEDKRAKVVRFSPDADQIRADAVKVLRGIEKELAKRLGEAEFEAMKKALSGNWGPIALIDLK